MQPPVCRCEPKEVCTTSEVLVLLRPVMLWALSLMVQTRLSMVCHPLRRTTSPPLMYWSTRFGPFSVVLHGCLCQDAICGLSFPVFALQTRLYAALVHGEFTNAYLFLGNMPSGTNAVVEVIHRSFLTCLCFTNHRLPVLNMHCCTATALQNSSYIHW